MQEHGSNTLALLRKYKFTIAIENYLSHDYVSERFYQPLLAGSVPVPTCSSPRAPSPPHLLPCRSLPLCPPPSPPPFP